MHQSLDKAANGKAAAWVDLFDRPAPPDRQQLDWAAEICEQLQQQKVLTPAEQARFEAICADYLASRRDLPAPSLDELSWVLGLQRDLQVGARLDDADEARLWDICARFLLEQEQLLERALADLPRPSRPPTPEERAWAAGLYQRALAGLSPSLQEYQRFLAVLAACRAYGLRLNMPPSQS